MNSKIRISTTARVVGTVFALSLGLLASGCSPEANTGGTGSGGTTVPGTGGTTVPGTGGTTVAGTGGTTVPGTGGTTVPGTGGTTVPGTGGRGGATVTGTGGVTVGGTGGVTVGGTGGVSVVGLPLCASPAPADKSACNADPSCTKNCGVNLGAGQARALKACACSGAAPAGLWACPSALGACVYPAGASLTCFRLPAPLPACPADAAQPTGLVRSGVTTCPAPAAGACGMVCGSATAMSYQDSTTAKIGYCACVAGLWQCASVNEWPIVP